MKKAVLLLIAVMSMVLLCGCMSTNTGDVDPNEVAMSVTGIDDNAITPIEIDSIDILKDGQAVVHATGKLLDTVGENYIAAMGVAEAHVLYYGNAGYRCVVFLMKDGTVSALSGKVLVEKHDCRLKTNLGKLENIVKVEGNFDESGYYVIATNKDGEQIMLDEYLDF